MDVDVRKKCEIPHQKAPIGDKHSAGIPYYELYWRQNTVQIYHTTSSITCQGLLTCLIPPARPIDPSHPKHSDAPVNEASVRATQILIHDFTACATLEATVHCGDLGVLRHACPVLLHFLTR
jgi:hypothetical protein